jgi:hypothetical protein
MAQTTFSIWQKEMSGRILPESTTFIDIHVPTDSLESCIFDVCKDCSHRPNTDCKGTAEAQPSRVLLETKGTASNSVTQIIFHDVVHIHK